MVQIERIEGPNNVKESCPIQGVDLVFVEPNDLALALLVYTPAKYTELEFLGALDNIFDAARKHGKKVGMLATDGEQARIARHRFDRVAIGTNVRAMQAFYRTALEKARSCYKR